MSTTSRYNEFPTFLRRYFPYKAQRISLNAGFTCPSRDGSKGHDGCTYCNNQTFNPDYCRTERPICLQPEEGKCFFARKYPEVRYLAYFQAHTNIYGELESLKRKYKETPSMEGVAGLVIGTHPDCVPDDLLRYLESINKHAFLLVERGIESTCDEILHRTSHGHTSQTAAGAICRTAACGILIGRHVILGSSGEVRQSAVAQAHDLSQLPSTALKTHQLRLIWDIRIALEYEWNPEDFHLLDIEEYTNPAVGYMKHLHSDIALERFVSQSPKDLLVAPDWGLKNYEFDHQVQKRMKELDVHQGKKYEMREKSLVFTVARYGVNLNRRQRQ